MELRSCRPDDRKKAIALSRSVFKDNMESQFLCLFGEQNRDRMFLAFEGEEVVSMVNYYPAAVQIGPATVMTASVGSVCTKAEFRGQKLASRLLTMAASRMRAEAVHVVIISGQGGIYSAFGAEFAGNATEWFVPQGTFPSSPRVSLAEYTPADLPAVKLVYETEPVRFVRRELEFDLLIRGQTYPDLHTRYPFELILAEGKVVAYAILDLSDDETDDTLGIKEYAGDRLALTDAFDLLLKKYGRRRMHFAADPHDPLEKLVAGCEKRPIHQFASLKILDFSGFMAALRPYWETLVPESAGRVSWEEREGMYAIRLGPETLVVDDGVKLTRFVFGFTEPAGIDFSRCPELEKWAGKVFPIPFPWTHNLNYQ